MAFLGYDLGSLGFTGFLIFLRLTAFVTLLPGFGDRATSVRLKVMISLLLTSLVLPLMGAQPMAEGATFVSLAVAEVTVGVLFGLGARLYILAIQTAGTIAAQSTSLSQIFGGASAEPIPALGFVLVVAAVALFMALDLHVASLLFLVRTYEWFPLGGGLNSSEFAQWGIGRTSHAFSLAFALSLPFVITSLIYNCTLGIINRAMPQLMVAFVGAPIITFVGLLLLFLTAPMMLMVWVTDFDSFLSSFSR